MRNGSRCCVLVVCIGTMLFAASAHADVEDLKQTIADLDSQVRDKQRIDRRRAAKIELSQVAGWLSEAKNAIKEQEPEQSRRLFQRIRAQLRLVDQLIELAKLETQLAKTRREIGYAKQVLTSSKSELVEKQGKLGALRVMTK